MLLIHYFYFFYNAIANDPDVCECVYVRLNKGTLQKKNRLNDATLVFGLDTGDVNRRYLSRTIHSRETRGFQRALTVVVQKTRHDYTARSVLCKMTNTTKDLEIFLHLEDTPAGFIGCCQK